MSKASKITRVPGSMGLPFSTAVRVGDVWELSGQIGIDADSGKLVDGGVAAETRQTLENIRQVLKQIGSSMDDVIKVGVFLKNIEDFDEMNKVYAEFFSADAYPSRSAVAVAGLALGAHVEIECSVVAGD